MAERQDYDSALGSQELTSVCPAAPAVCHVKHTAFSFRYPGKDD